MRTQPQEVIAKLEADNSRLKKEAIVLDAMKEGLDEFFEGLKMCLDKLYTFGVKQVPTKDDVISAQGCEWKVFKKLAEQLYNRELTGHAARDAIKLVMSSATAEQWNGFYRRILIKDLRCGVTEKTVNNVAKKNKFKQYMIPVFTCQLAQDSAKHDKKLTGKKMLEVKLDGARVVSIVYPDGKVDMFSRNGKELINFGHIAKEISEVVKRYKLIVLSDEIYSELTFDGDCESILNYCSEKVIVSNGLSKWCGAGGWRLGYFIIPEALKNLRDSLKILASETFSSVSAPIQYSAIAAYNNNHEEYINNSRLILKEVGEYVYENLKSNKININRPQGGFYLMPEFLITKFSTSEEMCSDILKETGVALLPGSDFGFSKERMIARLSFTDFDGNEFMKNIKQNKKIDLNLISKFAPKIIEGTKKLKTWSESI